jgi:hypothetical protein
MKRITLLGSSKSASPGLPWDVQVANAVCAGDHDTLLGLVGQPGGKRRLREGFTIGFQNGNTFARLCMHTGSIDALRTVVAAAPDGVTLHDTCVHHVIDDSRGRGMALEVYTEMQLHEEAVGGDHPSPEALALALEYEPDHSCITGHLERFQGATLHYQALYAASMSKNVERAQKLADCCRLLVAKGAPVGHKALATSSHYDMLFQYRWNRDGIQDVMVPLIGDYVHAGFVRLDSPPAPGCHLPVIQAILAGNGYAAAAAIDLGCDVELAVRGFHFVEHQDLLDVARSCITSPDLIDETVALVTEALMRRKLSALAATLPEPGSQNPRRAARADI